MENIMTCSKWHAVFYFWILHSSSFLLSPNLPYHMFEHKNTNTHKHTHTTQTYTHNTHTHTHTHKHTHTHTLSILKIAPMLVPFGLVFYSFAYLMYKYQVRWSDANWIELKWGLIDFSFSKLDEVLVGLRCGVVWCGVVWCGVVWCGVVWCIMSFLDGSTTDEDQIEEDKNKLLD